MTSKVSFYTTCMGRLRHLKQTLPRNIEWAKSYGNVQFVILDFNSPDGLEEWARQALLPHIQAGLVVYAKTYRPCRFEMAKAKNVAALLTSGDIICNLDADNFLGEGFVEHLASLVGPKTVVRPGGNPGGAAGRVAMLRRDFLMLGGYDERFVGWGFDENDVVDRAMAAGFAVRYSSPQHNLYLDHPGAERERFCGGSMWQTNAANKALSARAIKSGRLVANRGRLWGYERVTLNFTDDVTVGPGPMHTPPRSLVRTRGGRIIRAPASVSSLAGNGAAV